MLNPTRARLRFLAFFVRHSRAYLATHWTVTVALAVVLLAASQPSPALGLKTQPGPGTVLTACPTGQMLVHFSDTDTVRCLIIVGAGF